MTIRDRAIQRAYEKLLERKFWAVRSDAAAIVDAVLGEIEPDEATVAAALEAFTNRWPAVIPSVDMMEETIWAAIKHIREGGE